MTGKRFTTDNGSHEDVCLVDNLTKKEYESNFEDMVSLMNDIWNQTQRFEKHNQRLEKENEQLKSIKKFADRNGICIFNIDEAFRRCWQDNAKLVKENEKLKSTVKEVLGLLSDEVDLFSDKATEHDINAYVELKELDNKDAFYMATATKKAIKMLNEL